METLEQVYKGGTPYQNNQQWADTNCTSYGRGKKEEDPSRHPNLGRAPLASAREII